MRLTLWDLLSGVEVVDDSSLFGLGVRPFFGVVDVDFAILTCATAAGRFGRAAALELFFDSLNVFFGNSDDFCNDENRGLVCAGTSDDCLLASPVLQRSVSLALATAKTGIVVGVV